MKVVILAGGLGTRLEEETIVTPKPLVAIGEYPILWHIMKLFYHYGFNEFVICLGYKGYMIKEYFANYFLHQSDVTFDFSSKDAHMTIHNKEVEPWKVTLIDTGHNVQTGGRIKRIKPYVKDETFMLTYGDAVSDINIKSLVDFHSTHKKSATVTAIRPPGKFGVLDVGKDTKVKSFKEKPDGDGNYISGGFFVLNSNIFKYIKEGDDTIWEGRPLEIIAQEDQMQAYKHTGFWQCMDTMRDKRALEERWKSGKAPWKVWN